MKKFIRVILSIVLFAVFSSFLIFINLKRNLNLNEVIAHTLSLVAKTEPIENKGLFYPEQKEINLVAFDNITDFTNSFLKGKNINVDEKLILEIIDDKETKALIDNYTNEYINHVKNPNNEFKIDRKILSKFINNAAKKYEKYTGEKLDYQEIENIINSNIIPEIEIYEKEINEEEISDSKIQNAKNISEYNKLISFSTIFILFVVIIILIIAIISLSNSLGNGLISVSIPCIISSILLFLISLLRDLVSSLLIRIFNATNVEKLSIFINQLVNKFFTYLKIESFISIFIFIVVIIIGVTLNKKIKEDEQLNKKLPEDL